VGAGALAAGKLGVARYGYPMAAEQATDGKAASGVGKPQVFRSPTAVIVWVVWLIFTVANYIDLAVQGHDHTALVAAAILLMITGVAYVTAQRPRLIAGDDVLTVRNPLRDHRIPWRNILRVDVSDLLRVHCRLPGPAREGAGKEKSGKVISAWAVHYSRRRQYSADVKSRRDAMRGGPRRGRMSGMSQFGIPQTRSNQPASYGTAVRPEAEALKIVRVLNERAETARNEHDTENGQLTGRETILGDYAVGQAAGSPDSTVLMTSTWSWRAIVALVVPAVILLICCLI
jgi:hypothetical protein